MKEYHVSKTDFQYLIHLMSRLRGPAGCPWDREQTHQTLKPFLLEETYEVLESIDVNDPSALKEELGDLLLQIVFHARVAEECGYFTIQDVIQGLIDKLIRRHPHVFGNADIKTAEEQTIHWERLKKTEGKRSVLSGVPEALPSLLRAYRIQQKASAVGFDWNKADDAWDKVKEEMDELIECVKKEEKKQTEEELGDLLFALVNYARFIKVEPEDALRRAVNKFIERFKKVEQVFDSRGRSLQDSTLEEMDAVWEEIKKTNTG